MVDLAALEKEDGGVAADATLAAAIVPTLSVVAPALLVAGLAWLLMPQPLAPFASGVLLASSALLGGLALVWHRNPPFSVYLAAAVAISLLQICSMALMIVLPDPALGSLHIIVALGAAFFLVDWRWMLSLQLFGVITWFAAVVLASPPSEWVLHGHVLGLGVAAAIAFRVARMGIARQTAALRLESERRSAEQAKAEAALRLSEAGLRHAQRIANVGSYEWTIATGSLTWSAQNYRLFGLDPSGTPITNQRFIDMVHPEDREKLVDMVTASLKEREIVDVTYRVTRPDGEERLLRGRGETTFDEFGTPVSFFGTTVDLSEPQRAREALHASEERTGAILDALDLDRAVVIERGGRLVSLLSEPGGSGRYGPIAGSEIPGLHVRDFVPGDAGERLVDAVNSVYETGEPMELEEVVDFPTGRFYFDVSLRALRRGSGDIESVLALVRDVSARKNEEQALQQTQKLESLGVLAGGIAHDFNNLLVGIMSNADSVLAGNDLRNDGQQQLQDILQASTRAADLTRELLAYAGEASLSPEVVDLRALVAEMGHLIPASTLGSARLEFESSPDPLYIDADATQIRQVVMNFITNAAEALEGGGGRVCVRTGATELDEGGVQDCYIRADAVPGEYCWVEVADDGVGMDRETVDRIFDPFFTTKFHGRGLGLSATLGIVRNHGGMIQVDSEPSVGTTLRVYLPRVEAGAAEEKPPALVAAPGNECVLVVDDEELVRTAAGRMLRAHGYEVIEVTSGYEALDAVSRAAPSVDIVLLDMTMPGMSGEETLERLREVSPNLPAVFMTGHSPDRSAAESTTAYVQKPFRVAVLIATMRELLDAPDRAGVTRSR